jgi:hypothetical protein
VRTSGPVEKLLFYCDGHRAGYLTQFKREIETAVPHVCPQ